MNEYISKFKFHSEKQKFSRLSGVYGLGRQKWILELDSTGQKRKKNFLKIPAVPKIHGRYSEWHAITVSKKMLKTSKMIFFLFQLVYFDRKNINLMFISVGRERKLLIIQKKKTFSESSRSSVLNYKIQLLRFNYWPWSIIILGKPVV